jgi:hypothetical protein
MGFVQRQSSGMRVVMIAFGLILLVPLALTATWWLAPGIFLRPPEHIGVQMLRQLASAEEVYRSKHGAFWVGDVAGLYAEHGLIDHSVAAADARPIPPALVATPAPKRGYLVAAIASLDDGKHQNKERFAFCSYPAHYPDDGKFTFLLDSGMLWRKDIGGKPVEALPQDPAKDGWSRLD